ncbi:ribbon-helix-helix domain-containing protein [Tundrisphaera sp. TA3]|uniref:ribbon-helix-helix domain-containing protein n=1 Tax=Tundrisphaera sp. TA3 TaxID=3435775 RepID=UPI003EBDB38E
MTIHLPDDLEHSIRSLVKGGRYSSVDEAMTDAARLLLGQASSAGHTTTEREILQHMLDSGLLSQLPDTEADHDDHDDQPIVIDGEPLSETVVRERR